MPATSQRSAKQTGKKPRTGKEFCHSRKRYWRRLVPQGTEIPPVPSGEPALVGEALEAADLPAAYSKCYCHRHAGAGTDHRGSGRCKDHLGNQQGKGSASPAWKHGAYAERARAMMTTEARETADALYQDPDLLAIRMDLVQIRRRMLDMIELIEAGEGITLTGLRALRKKAERLELHIEAGDIDGARGIAEDIREHASSTADSEKVHDKYLALLERMTRLGESERERLIALQAMLPVERVEVLRRQIFAVIVQAVEGAVPVEYHEPLFAALRTSLMAAGETRKNEMLGITPPIAEAV